MTSHEAASQMTGYLYQVRYALLLLLESEKQNNKISIEKFDDISFDDGFSAVEMIQTKHHGVAGDLGDKSVDLWKTIKVWLDQIEEHPDLLTSCRFLLITTQTASEDSAASLLRKNHRDEEKAIRLLQAVAEKRGNEALYSIYDKFLETEATTLKDLFKAIEVVDGAPQVSDLEGKIRNRVRLCCYHGYEERVMEQVEGWWFRLAVKALSSPDHTLLDFIALQNKVVAIGHQYQPDNMPIEDWAFDEISDVELEQDQRIFVQQLRLIEGNNRLLRQAIKNYYRAYQQRSRWAREEELLLPNELEDYEKRLLDEWEQTKALMEDDDDAAKQGRELYRRIMEKDITIRKLCTAPFVMRGSYEMLADKLEVGWHRDFVSRLSSLLAV